MIIRLDKDYKAEVLPEDAIVVGNNKTNNLKVFMYDGFSFRDNNAFANFEINDEYKYTNLVMSKESAKNELGVEEKCFFYSIPKFIAKRKGVIHFSLRFSPLRDQTIIKNTKTLVFKIDYAITPDGEEILDPTTLEELRKEIGQAELNANNYTDEVALKKVDKDFSNYPILDHKDIGAKDVIVINKVNEDGTTTIHKLEAQDLYNDVNGVKPDDKGSININSNDIPYKDTSKSVTNELDNKLNLDDDVVHYKESPEDVGYPLLTVINAEYAETANKDNLGNVINETYVKVEDNINTNEIQFVKDEYNKSNINKLRIIDDYYKRHETPTINPKYLDVYLDRIDGLKLNGETASSFYYLKKYFDLSKIEVGKNYILKLFCDTSALKNGELEIDLCDTKYNEFGVKISPNSGENSKYVKFSPSNSINDISIKLFEGESFFKADNLNIKIMVVEGDVVPETYIENTGDIIHENVLYKELREKQNKLYGGVGIDISGDVISVDDAPMFKYTSQVTISDGGDATLIQFPDTVDFSEICGDAGVNLCMFKIKLRNMVTLPSDRFSYTYYSNEVFVSYSVLENRFGAVVSKNTVLKELIPFDGLALSIVDNHTLKIKKQTNDVSFIELSIKKIV